MSIKSLLERVHNAIIMRPRFNPEDFVSWKEFKSDMPPKPHHLITSASSVIPYAAHTLEHTLMDEVLVSKEGNDILIPESDDNDYVSQIINVNVLCPKKFDEEKDIPFCLNKNPFSMGFFTLYGRYSSSITLMQTDFSKLMKHLCNQIGHVLTPILNDEFSQYVAAFAFELAMEEEIRWWNIGGLRENIPFEPRKYNSVLLQRAYNFVYDRVKAGEEPEHLYHQLINRQLTLESK